MQSADQNPFWRNCEKETTSSIVGYIQGTLPTWLNGELIQVGPGIKTIGNDQYKHALDGLAILHKFTMKDGQAFYQSQFLKSDAYKKNMEANRIVVSEFGTSASPDPCQSIFGKFKAEFTAFKSILKKSERENRITDNCVINVVYYGDQLFAMTETNFTRRIDPTTLETLGEKTNISDYLAVNSATAHPHTLEDGTVINMGNIFRHPKGPHYAFISVPPPTASNSKEDPFKNAKLIAEIPSRWKLHSAYFHSFGITSSGKIIFVESPLKWNLLGLATGELLNFRKPYSEWMKWNSKEKTRFYVVSANTGKVHPVTYETDRLFLFHHINAYEENDQLVVDVAGYSDGQFVTQMNSITPGKFSDQPSARRYILPLNINSSKPSENLAKCATGITATAVLRKDSKSILDVTPHHLTDGYMDLPKINYKYNGKPYKYFYGIGPKRQKEMHESGVGVILKVDVSTGEILYWDVDESHHASEPVFVPDTTKEDGLEDDGVILAALLPLYDPKLVYLLILNAKNMMEIGRVKFEALGTMTGTFHGLWSQSKNSLNPINP